MRDPRYGPLCLSSFLSGFKSSKSPTKICIYVTCLKRPSLPYYQWLLWKWCTFKNLTWKLNIRLALTSTVRSSGIYFLDAKYLLKYSARYVFYFRKNSKVTRQRQPTELIKFHPYRENKPPLLKISPNFC